MADALIIKNSIEIKADPARVWATLTEPALVKQYMYNCDLETDWKTGSPVEFYADVNGSRLLVVKGHVVAVAPQQRLEYTVFDPNGEYRDEPFNYLTVVYELTPQNGGTILRVQQGDYSKVEKGESRYNDAASEGGWAAILEQVKKLAEQAV